MTIARLSDGLSTVGELIEYPPELEGGRNLIQGTSTSYESQKISPYAGTVSTRKTIKTLDLEVGDFLTFQAYIKNEDGKKSRIRMTTYDEENGSKNIRLSKQILEGEGVSALTIEIDENVYSIDFQIANESKDVDENIDIIVQYKNVKLEKGNKATPWTPAPEDLELDYPDWVQNFTTSFCEHGIITQEFIEGENTSLSDKIKTKHLKEGGL